MSERLYDGPLVVVASEWMDDWYIIEKPNGGRISDADVEGTLDEMVALARAIESRGREGFRRCAVDASGDRVVFWSPRNSMVEASCAREVALELAEQIKDLAQKEVRDEPR